MHQTTRVGSTTELKRFTVRQFQPIKRRSPNFLEAAVAKVGNGSVSASDIHRQYVRFSFEVSNSGQSAPGPIPDVQARAWQGLLLARPNQSTIGRQTMIAALQSGSASHPRATGRPPGTSTWMGCPLAATAARAHSHGSAPMNSSAGSVMALIQPLPAALALARQYGCDLSEVGRRSRGLLPPSRPPSAFPARRESH